MTVQNRIGLDVRCIQDRKGALACEGAPALVRIRNDYAE